MAWHAEAQSLPSFRSLDEVLIQFVPHFRSGLENPRLYGRSGNSQGCCDVLHRAPFQFIELKEAPCIGPKLAKRFPQNSRSFLASAVLLGVRRQVCYRISKPHVLRFGMLLNRDLHFSRLLAELHKSDIDRNAREPGGEAGAALEILQMNKCHLESFLHNVFRVLAVSHNALCEVENPALVAIEELAKGDRMAALRRSQQLRVTAPPGFQFGNPRVAP